MLATLLTVATTEVRCSAPPALSLQAGLLETLNEQVRLFLANWRQGLLLCNHLTVDLSLGGAKAINTLSDLVVVPDHCVAD